MGGFEVDEAPGRVVAMEPGRRFSLEWPGFGVSSWEPEGSDGATRLTFMMSGFEEDSPLYAGWMGRLSGVAELRRFHEPSDRQPIWFDFEPPALPEETAATR
ncbi:hypothetical protein [Streptosporangium amethystogenes]|uniref:hypothetical protein n=1 Tax=Streptosporangium amethystogenes TaxID=2002 RepID=UPI0004CB4E08|nr:hypothetical protein [Streptosporangium amethystogenes]